MTGRRDRHPGWRRVGRHAAPGKKVLKPGDSVNTVTGDRWGALSA
jgi:hypothetical protein